jgi:uncharacterized protein YoxC
VSEPLFWLALSLLLVAVSLTAVLVALLPAIRELSRAARSAEKLFDTLNRDLPPTLEAIRQTGLELTELTDDVSEGVQSAGRMVKQVDQSLLGVQKQAKKAQHITRSLAVGFRAAWQTLLKPAPQAKAQPRRRSAGSGEIEGDRPGAYPEAYGAQDAWEEYDDPHYGTPHSIYEVREDVGAAGFEQELEYPPPRRPLDWPPGRSTEPATERSTQPQPNANPDSRSADCPSAQSPNAELDSLDPDSYTPKVYGSEQYDDPSLWDNERDPEPARPGEAAPLEPGT